ncbi:DrmB family protein [Microbispora siamensis]
MSSRKLRVRQAQTVVPFGVGAVFDVQGESFVAAGIADWPSPRNLERIHAPRLERKLKVTGLWAPLQAPVADYDVPDASGPAFIRFPAWLFCGSCRRMTHWRIQDEKFGHPPYCAFCSPRHKLTPMRFVQICEAGHLGDVDWWYWAHSELTPEERDRCPGNTALSFEAGENATGLEALTVRCRHEECAAAQRDLLDILGMQKMRCCGRNPWERFSERKDCGEQIQIVQRTAGNVYYPVVHSALDIPAPAVPVVADDEATRRVRENLYFGMLCQSPDAPGADRLIVLIAEVAEADPSLVKRLAEEETGQAAGPEAAPTGEGPDLSRAEWAAFTATKPARSTHFVTHEVNLGSSRELPWTELEARISRVVVAERIREVRALQGFSRVSPEGRMVPVDPSGHRRWLPAIEVFGEGIFLTLNEELLGQWEALPHVRARTAGMQADLAKSFQRDRIEAFAGPRLLPRLPLLHTLGHLLVRQLSFESGYSAASLRERVYARSVEGDGHQYGLLIYTASGDAEGTLGGLARQGEPDLLPELLLRLLEQAAWCSADPLCSEHGGQGYGNLNRAACHACALIPETSCEVGNILLDRVMVVGGSGVPGFFEPVVQAAREEAADQAGAW